VAVRRASGRAMVSGIAFASFASCASPRGLCATAASCGQSSRQACPGELRAMTDNSNKRDALWVDALQARRFSGLALSGGAGRSPGHGWPAPGWPAEAARERATATIASRETVVRATRRLTAPARKPIAGGPRRNPA
jgi:hypothetical protein